MLLLIIVLLLLLVGVVVITDIPGGEAAEVSGSSAPS